MSTSNRLPRAHACVRRNAFGGRVSIPAHLQERKKKQGDMHCTSFSVHTVLQVERQPDKLPIRYMHSFGVR
jgi:hypothetical protein